MNNLPYELYLRPNELRHGKSATLTISNLSDSVQTFQVVVDGADTFNLQVVPQIEIGAGEQALLPIKVSAETRKLFGFKDEQPLQLRVSNGTQTTQTLTAPISIPPRIPIWLAPLIGLIIILAAGYTVLGQQAAIEVAEATSTLTAIAPLIEEACAVNVMGVFRPNTLNPSSGTFIDGTAPPYAIQSLQFLEMPFPIDGSNTNFGSTAAQFRQASRAVRYGGRIYSYFDHFYPLYPAPSAGAVTQGREPAQAPVGGNMLLYDGSLVPTGYSGHPAYDYSPFVPRTATTPLFAAAAGIVESVAIHGASGAYFVRILHSIPNEGNYLTIYWHLHPDEHYEAMRSRVGQPIQAGERVGTLGNTGWSTGHHLHFEVRLDGNNDGIFSTFEKVDPYGFVPSADYPQDPWATAFSITDAQGHTYTHTPLASRYLWKHSLGFSAQIPDNGGGVLPSTATGGAGMGGCAPANTFPPGGVINFAWVPDPSPTQALAGTGQACALSVFDAEGNAVTNFGQPLRIEIPFSFDNLQAVDAATLAVYWKAAGDSTFKPLNTDVQFDDAGGGIAIAYTQEAGHCALMGQPSHDFLPPTSQIMVTGDSSDGGTSWYDSVTVSLVSSAEDLAQIEYSLDGGESWQPYSEPFELAVGAVPELANGIPEEGFQTGVGRYLVLAAGIDQTGNIESPPQSRAILIDPSKNPAAPTVTPEPEVPPTITPSPTNTPTITPTDPPTIPVSITPTFTPKPAISPPTITPQPPTITPYFFTLTFSAQQPLIPFGQCTNLIWDTENIRAIYIEGKAVGWDGTLEVCPKKQTTTYNLRAVRYDGAEELRQVTVSLEATPTPSLTPSPTPTITPTPTPAIKVLNFTYQITWSSNPNASVPSSTAQIKITATGGDGNYHYFLDDVKQKGNLFQTTVLACNKVTFILKVTSGDGQKVEKITQQEAPCPQLMMPTPILPSGLMAISCQSTNLVSFEWSIVSLATEYEFVLNGPLTHTTARKTNTLALSLPWVVGTYSWSVRAIAANYTPSEWATTPFELTASCHGP